jgi:hypothetical protein
MSRAIGSILVGLLVLAAGSAPRAVQGQGGAQAYMLDADTVSSVLGGAKVMAGPRHYEDWDATAEYTLADFDVWVAASVFDNADQARQRVRVPGEP